MNTYVIHATCRYVVKSRETGRTESGQNRPTIAVDATSESAAIRKATREQRKRIGTDHWPVVSFHLIPELVNVIEHPTAAQKKALRNIDRPGGSRRPRVDRGMLRRLVEKGWVDSTDGPDDQPIYTLTAAGRREAGDR